MPEGAYCFAGLKIASPIPLAGPFLEEAEPDVFVSLGTVPERLEHPRVTGEGFQGAPGRWLCRPVRGARTDVIDGERIVLDLPDGFPSRRAQVVLEQCVPAILQMRGVLPLHASAVRYGEIAWLFLGPSQAGKSSLAAALAELGAAAVSDDLSALRVGEEVCLLGGTGMLKVGEEFSAGPSLVGDLRARRSLTVAPAGPIRVGGLYVLTGGDLPQVRALSADSAMQALLQHSYGPIYARAFGTERSYFANLTRLIERVPICSLEMPRGPESIRATAGWLLGQGRLSQA